MATKKSSRIYFTQAVATASGDAFLAGHMQDQESEPTFTRFFKVGDAGWGHLGDLGAVAYAAVGVPVENAPRPWIAVLGRDGPLRLYKPGQPPVDRDIPNQDKSAWFEGMCPATDGLYVCGGQRQVLRFANDQWQPVDQGLFVKFDGSNDCALFAIAEASPGCLIAVGSGGLITCRAQGGAWKTLDSGTNLDLHCIVPAGDGGAWVGGDGGTLLKIAPDLGSVQDCSVSHVSTRTFDSLALHKGTLYVAAFNAVLMVQPGKALEEVKGPFKKGSEFHAVSAAGDYVWATGDEHAYRLDSDGWKYYQCPDNI